MKEIALTWVQAPDLSMTLQLFFSPLREQATSFLP